MKTAYTLENISFSYGKKEAFLKIPRLDIPLGKITALTGPNGSGKTTLLHILAFLETTQSSRIRFCGNDVSRSEMPTFRKRVGLLMQNPYMFHGSVMANVEYGLKLRGIKDRQKQVLAALDDTGLSGLKNSSATHLSGGETKRVALARAIVLKPEVLLLDEPATHMDKESTYKMEEIIQRLNKDHQTTVIFTTHDLKKGYMLAEVVLPLFNGRIVSAPLLNLFKGNLCEDKTTFNTDHIKIHLPAGSKKGTHITVDPSHIVLSKDPLASSMRNNLRGRLTAISEENGQVLVSIEAGETFHAVITRESFFQLNLNLGGEIWISFKSSAVKLL